MRVRLPNLPAEDLITGASSGSEHNPPEKMAATPLDLIHRLLVYPPEARIRAADALKHPWFISEGDDDDDTQIPVLLPPERRVGLHFHLPRSSTQAEVPGAVDEWHGKPLGHWLELAFKRG